MEGSDVQKVEDMDKVMEELTCLVCFGVAEEAMEQSCCNRVVCRVHLEDMERFNLKCPGCRQTRYTTSHAKAVRRVINRLGVKCEWCGNTVERGNREAHEGGCKIAAGWPRQEMPTIYKTLGRGRVLRLQAGSRPGPKWNPFTSQGP